MISIDDDSSVEMIDEDDDMMITRPKESGGDK